MDEQPVALATISRSPNSWESSLMYGVSPHPAHAPENSKSGSRNWVPRTVPKSTLERSLTVKDSKKLMFSRSETIRGSAGPRLIALVTFKPGMTTGQASTHKPHPVQSSTYTCNEYLAFGRPTASNGAESNVSGAPANADWS